MYMVGFFSASKTKVDNAKEKMMELYRGADEQEDKHNIYFQMFAQHHVLYLFGNGKS